MDRGVRLVFSRYAARSFTRLADEVEHMHPGAAGSLREGMDGQGNAAKSTTTVELEDFRGDVRR
ncbi:MAG: hypothetical protein ACXVE9_18190 [Solirubrobacteraceae bacterium]